jgi:hypothetical protein
MANYKEQTSEINIQGEVKSWLRARSVVINGKIPQIQFSEEKISIDPLGKESHFPSEVLTQQLLDPAVEFDILNPETDEVIGISTYGQIYTILYSLYIKLAKERDLRNG